MDRASFFGLKFLGVAFYDSATWRAGKYEGMAEGSFEDGNCYRGRNVCTGEIVGSDHVPGFLSRYFST